MTTTRINVYLKALCQWPHRGTTTGYEHRAADYVRDMLGTLGYEVEEERFTAPDGALYRTFIMLATCEIAAAAISFTGSPAAVIIALFPFFYLFAKFLLMWPIDNIIFPSGSSRNVIGRLKNPGAKKTVILSAHLDTQLGSFLYDDKWVGYHDLFTQVAGVGSVITVILAIIRVAGGSGGYLTLLQVATALALAPMLCLFARAELTGSYVQGAGDDASGLAAVLSLAEDLKQKPPENAEVWVVATGAEETGLCGMIHFLKRGAGKNLDRDSTFFINFDNLGGGSLRYLTGEVIPAIRYRERLIKIAELAAEDPRNPDATPGFWGMPTDALAPTIKGRYAITLFGYDENGRTPHYHHASDTVENVDPAIAEAAGAFALGMIRIIDSEPEEDSAP